VSGISAEHYRVFILRVRHEDRTPVPTEQDRTAPPVRDSDFAERRMKVMNAVLDGLEEIICLPLGYIDLCEIARVVRVDEPGAEYHASVAPTPAPEVWQIDCVEGVPAGKSDGFEPLFIDGLGQDGERELGFGAARK
jgi:hypothetical protein